MKKILSIIIVSFNSKEYLIKCLKSLSSSTLLKETEIIVVDNASNDGTDKFLSVNYKNIRLIKNSQNEGFAKANNQGIKISEGNYILLLNPDTIVPPETLKHMIVFMEKHQNTGVATCYVQLANGSIDDACHRGFPTPWNSFCHFSGLASIFPKSEFLNGYHLGYKNLDKMHEIDSCTGAFMLIRKSIGEKLNWLDEEYFWYGEDIDFCYRVKKIGFTVFFVPEVRITHFKGMSSGIKKHSESVSSASFETKLKATHARFSVMEIFYKKHYQHSFGKLLMPFIFAGIRLKEILTVFSLKLKQYENRV